jgi:hypothetical protein
MEVQHFPDCYEPNIKTVAVLPFKNESTRARAGLMVASNLAEELKSNATYMVFGPNEVRDVLKQSGQKISDMDFKNQARIVNEHVRTDAFITGSVIEDRLQQIQYYANDMYDVFPYEYGRTDNRYMVYPYEYGGVYHNYGMDYDTEVYSQAFVKVQSSMIDSSTGNLICSTPGVIEGSANLRGFGSDRLKTASTEAVTDAVKKMEYQFAVVSVKVKISNDFVKTASNKTDNKWHFANSFKKTDNEINAVIKLPEEAANNNFKLTITPPNQLDNVLLSKDFTWETGDKEKSISFPTQNIGAGKYSINLYSLGEPVLSKNFTLKE